MNIKAARNAAGMTQQAVADHLHIMQTSYARYESGKREPDINTLNKLAKLFGVSVDFLTKGEVVSSVPSPEIKSLNGKDYISIPVYGVIPAGIPFEAIQDIIDYEDIAIENTIPGHGYFALKIKGDSMEPEYRDNDIIIIQQQDHCNSGDDCAVMINGDDATFKRVRLQKNGLTLQPLNQKYEPRFYTAEEVRELPIRILGIVVEIRRRMIK